MSRLLRRPTLRLLLLATGVLFLLSACSGQIANTNWAGLSTDGSRVYLAYGPNVLAYDPATNTRNWSFPDEGGQVQFFSPPSAEGDRVIFGDYGRAGGFFSPRVTVSVYAAENVDSGVPRELWTNSESATDKIVAQPLLVDDVVYVGTADNHVLAFNAADGTELWDYETDHAIWAQPAHRDGTLYVTSMDRSVYALDAATGELVWQTTLDGALPSTPVLGDDLLYVSSFDGNVHALDVTSGEVQWSAPATDWVWGSPAWADGVVYFTDVQGNVFAVDAATGEQLWTQATSVRVQSAPVVAGDLVYIASQSLGDTPGGALTAYSTADGTQRWSQPVGAPLLATPVLVGDDSIVVGLHNADTLLIGFDLATGQELWRYSLPENAN